MEYIAHIRVSDLGIQSVRQHLLETKEICELHGRKLGIEKLAGLSGVLHDMGKASPEFYHYIQDAVYHPEKKVRRGSVDHSTAGGRLLFNQFHQESGHPLDKILAEVVGNAILSHHGYLTDYIGFDLESEFLRRTVEKELDSYSTAENYFFSEVMNESVFKKYVESAKKELVAFISPSNGGLSKERLPIILMYLTKTIFSILIDADRTNTRLYEENKILENELDIEKLFLDYQKKLVTKIEGFGELSKMTPINQLRARMSEETNAYAEKPSGIYTLSIPTGGGKTLASFRYALSHSLKYQKKRIIYVVPYVTIIEQNAQEIREIIKDDEHILEHHSNILFFKEDGNDEMEKADETIQKLRLAKDNWDSPVIFTSMVQFLNVFYASGTQNIRRLHNLSDAVIIFDEVQKVPTHCISLFNEALNYLSEKMNTSILLCTATQPALGGLKQQLRIGADSEIVSDLEKIETAFKRVRIIDESQIIMDTESLTHFIKRKNEIFNSQLVILNTKRTVLELYLSLKETLDDTTIFHLSTSMCAAHRKDILNTIKIKLKKQEKVICISTPLIEAGVDISFESVIRSLAGLDSIAQAAGRCNRHGELGEGKVYLIYHEEEKLDKLPEIKEGRNITKQLIKDIHLTKEDTLDDLLTTRYISRYFKQYYEVFKMQLDFPLNDSTYSHVDLLMSPKKMWELTGSYSSKYGKKYPLVLLTSLKTSAKKFEVIKNQTQAILVPYGEGKDIEIQLNSARSIPDLSTLLKKSQFYSVNVYNHELQRLESSGAITEYCDGVILILNEGYYDKEYGLRIEGGGGLSFLSM